MRRLPAWCLLGTVAVGGAGVAPGAGCLDIPAHQPCGGDDRDCDGWPANPTNPAAADCDDGAAAINPGASDDPLTAADEDCIADGAGVRLFGVTGNEASWTSGALTVGFGSTSRMTLGSPISGTFKATAWYATEFGRPSRFESEVYVQANRTRSKEVVEFTRVVRAH